MQELASGSPYMAELSVTQHTGAASQEFFHHDITNAYRNLTNVALRLRPRGSSGRAVMLMAHLDATIGSVGASDCATCVGVAIEAARAILSSPEPLASDLIVLLNGGEETLMQAAHGFYTQHPVRGAACKGGTRCAHLVRQRGPSPSCSGWRTPGPF